MDSRNDEQPDNSLAEELPDEPIIESYGIPIAYYDGKKVTPETYDILNTVFHKLICINEEIDYFVKTILIIVKRIRDDGGFAKQIVYKFKLFTCEFRIYDGRWKNVEEYPQEEIVLEDELKNMQ